MKAFVASICIAVLVAVVIGFSAPVFGSEVPRGGISFQLNEEIWSRYMGVNGAIFYEDPILVSELTVSHSSGAYVDIWNSIALDEIGGSLNWGNETDFTIGYTFQTGGMCFDVGVCYFDLKPLFYVPGGDIIRLHGRISKEFRVSENHTLTPWGLVRVYFPMRASHILERGELGYVGVSHSWNLGSGLRLSHGPTILMDGGPWGFDPGFLGLYNLDLTLNLTDRLKVDLLSVKLAEPITTDDTREFESVWGAGLSWRF